MQKIYFNVQWVSKFHPAYIAYGREWRISKSINRHEAEVDPSLQISRDAEDYARAFLGQTITLSDKTIISFLKRNSRGQLIQFYNEVDAVHSVDKDTVVIFEVKNSNRKGAFKKARQQLNNNAEILSLLYKKVFRCLIIVEPIQIEDEPDEAALSRVDFETIDSGFNLVNLPSEIVSEENVALIWLKLEA